VSLKAQTKGSLKAGLTSTVVVEKASQNKRLKADWISMGPATDGVPEGSLEVEGVCVGTNEGRADEG
jgi:hypothetical protein